MHCGTVQRQGPSQSTQGLDVSVSMWTLRLWLQGEDLEEAPLGLFWATAPAWARPKMHPLAATTRI